MYFVEKAVKSKGKKKTKVNYIPPLNKERVQKIIKQDLLDFKLWIENRNSRIYKIKVYNDKYIIAKQSKVHTLNSVKREFNSLKKLYKNRNNYFNTPEPLGLYQDYNTYLMSYIDELSIDQRIKTFDKNTMLNVCYLSGRALASIHEIYNPIQNYKGIRYIYNDILCIPYSFTKEEKKILSQSFDYLKDKKIPIGKIFKDYDPINLFFNFGKINIIDPPEKEFYGYFCWDLATFLVGLKKSFLRNMLIFSRSLLDECKYYFIKGYFSHQNKQILNNSTTMLILNVFELQRIGELMAFQQKHKKRQGILNPKMWYNYIAIKLLKREKKRKILEMKNLLKFLDHD